MLPEMLCITKTTTIGKYRWEYNIIDSFVLHEMLVDAIVRDL